MLMRFGSGLTMAEATALTYPQMRLILAHVGYEQQMESLNEEMKLLAAREFADEKEVGKARVRLKNRARKIEQAFYAKI